MTESIPRVITKILNQLNLREEMDVQDFLFPRLENLPKPSLMMGMKEAVNIAIEGIEEGVEFIIWGDYDVDGTTATSLLVNFFKELGIEAQWHIPNRLTEGYGLNSEKFKEFLNSIGSPKFILITVDCGISNRIEVEEVLTLGGEVIVTDHHQLPLDGLPGCVVLNPNQADCGFSEDKLAGVGVAFYFAAAIRAALEKKDFFRGISKPNLKDYLGFVALGTIADLVELTSTNRVLVRAGMEAMSGSTISGLRSLVNNAGLHVGDLTSEDISFQLGPRINAAGRLGKASVAVQLMTCDNDEAGIIYSRKLDSFNVERKGICENNLETALEIIRRDSSYYDSSPAIVVAGDFHVGVMGIVASKLVEIYRKPTIVFSDSRTNDDTFKLKGSGRSIEGVNLLECLHESSTEIEKYGGHAMAAGLTITEEKLSGFSKQFCLSVMSAKMSLVHNSSQVALIVNCSVDEIMESKALNFYKKLEPFGPKNEKPLFKDMSASVINCKAIGANRQHLQLTVRGKYSNYRGVGFGLGDRFLDVKRNPKRKILFTPMINRFRGQAEWQLRVVEI